jgi:hypothetical protein
MIMLAKHPQSPPFHLLDYSNNIRLDSYRSTVVGTLRLLAVSSQILLKGGTWGCDLMICISKGLYKIEKHFLKIKKLFSGCMASSGMPTNLRIVEAGRNRKCKEEKVYNEMNENEKRMKINEMNDFNENGNE